MNRKLELLEELERHRNATWHAYKAWHDSNEDPKYLAPWVRSMNAVMDCQIDLLSAVTL